MGNKWTPSDWTKASRADWDRLAEQTCREGQERFDRMSDEDWLNEVGQEWDGPISVSAAHFMSLFQDGQPPTESAPLPKGTRSRLASWIAMNLTIFPKEKINFIELLMIGWAYVSVFGCLIGCIILIVREILKLF